MLVPLAARLVVDPAAPVAVEALEEEVTTAEVPFAGRTEEEAEEVRVVGRTEEEPVGATEVEFVRAVYECGLVLKNRVGDTEKCKDIRWFVPWHQQR